MTDAPWTRPDGRAPAELRPLSIQTDFLPLVPAHALIRAGNTMVLCTASVQESVPPFLEGKGQGWLTAEYSMLPGSGGGRKKREIGQLGGRTQEIQRLIGRSLRAVCDMKRLGERTITIDCDVLQADGGTRTASITGGFVALGRAVEGLLKKGLVETSPLTDQVAAISVGMIGGLGLLDLPYVEDSRADVDMNVVMNGAGRFIEVQGTAEHQTFSREELDQMLALADAGIRTLMAAQCQALGWP